MTSFKCTKYGCIFKIENQGNVASGNERSQCFADFFEQKVGNIVENTVVDADGERIILANDEMFMSRQDIIYCMLILCQCIKSLYEIQF